MSLQLKTVPFEFDGKVFQLCCNMNVLAAVQERHGGNFLSALNSDASLSCVTEFLTAMLNDYADSQGWLDRYTQSQVGRMLDPSPLAMTERNKMVLGLVYSSIVPVAPAAQNNQKKNEISESEKVDHIDFSRYLLLWLHCRIGDERAFWKTATPVRCHLLYEEYMRMTSPSAISTEQPQTMSLHEYLMGGEP